MQNEGTEELKEFSQFIGKPVSLIVEDRGHDYPRKKTGILASANPTHLILKTDFGDIAVLRATVLRIELLKEGIQGGRL